MNNPFFKNYGPYPIKDLLKDLKIVESGILNEDKIFDIKDLINADKNHLTFFHSKKYHIPASKSKASYCITLKNLKDYLPKECKAICVENVLLSVSEITKKFYPDSVNDDFDNTVKKIDELNLGNDIEYGQNVLVGENVKIGSSVLVDTILLLKKM